jgi:hypothetical protein
VGSRVRNTLWAGWISAFFCIVLPCLGMGLTLCRPLARVSNKMFGRFPLTDLILNRNTPERLQSLKVEEQEVRIIGSSCRMAGEDYIVRNFISYILH